MYRFLLRPRWLAAHVVVAAVAVVLVNLGLWQLSRHEERSTTNARIAERLEQPPRDLGELAVSADDDLEFRRVRVTGRYLADEEVLLSPRGWHGQPGHHLLTPLVTENGDAILVDRGWVPFEHDSPPVDEASPPDGTVEVAGWLLPNEPAQRFAPELGDGRLAKVSRVDLGRLEQQLDRSLLPYYVQLRDQRPPTPEGSLPRPAEPPDVGDDGNHLSYAIQWFSFAAVGLVGYPLLIRRAARDGRDDGRAEDGQDGDRGDGRSDGGQDGVHGG